MSNKDQIFIGGAALGFFVTGLLGFVFHNLLNSSSVVKANARAHQATDQLTQCNQHLKAASLALANSMNGDVVVTPGSVCVINADPTLDETVFMGYLTSCRRGWDLRREQMEKKDVE